MAFTKCPDHNCPLKVNCLRYDRKAHFGEPGNFGNSPRQREDCLYFAPHDHTGPRPGKPEGNPPRALTSDWPKDPDA